MQSIVWPLNTQRVTAFWLEETKHTVKSNKFSLLRQPMELNLP